MEPAPFWERDDIARKFAERLPDHRLQRLISVWNGALPRVLDVGCAGGRNTAWLARKGVDVHAVDASATMVRTTRAALAEVVGVAEAERRVRKGRMEDLGDFEDASFDMVLGLGVYQNAPDADAWNAALAETARVLRPGGLCLVANFGPSSRPRGEPLERVPGSNVYTGFGPEPERRLTLLEPDALDAAFAAHGFEPAEPTVSVWTASEPGGRTTVNALYRKEPTS